MKITHGSSLAASVKMARTRRLASPSLGAQQHASAAGDARLPTRHVRMATAHHLLRMLLAVMFRK
jgi:hypothetical protein